MIHQPVFAISTIKNIRTDTTFDPVVIRPAKQNVISGTAVKQILSVTAKDGIVTDGDTYRGRPVVAVTGQLIITIATNDQIITGIAINIVVRVAANQNIFERRPIDIFNA